MNRKEIKEGRRCLLETGFTEAQVEHLSKFRHDYLEKEQRRSSAELRRLEFLRWLVTTGRLTG